MATTVEICNMALVGMGQNPITSLLEDSDEARACAAVFDLCRDDVLVAHPWNFATQRVQFARLDVDLSPTTSEYQFAYALPTETLRVLWVEPRSARWAVESGNRLLTNTDAPLRGAIIKRITDSGAFPPHFVNVLVYRLRVELNNALTARQGVSQNYAALYFQKLQEAKTIDGLEATPEFEDVSPIGAARISGLFRAGVDTF